MIVEYQASVKLSDELSKLDGEIVAKHQAANGLLLNLTAQGAVEFITEPGRVVARIKVDRPDLE